MLFPMVFRCWLLIQFLLSFYASLWCCLGSWDEAKLHLNETVFVLVFYTSLLKNILFPPFLFFLFPLWFLFWRSRLSSSWNLCIITIYLQFNHCSAERWLKRRQTVCPESFCCSYDSQGCSCVDKTGHLREKSNNDALWPLKVLISSNRFGASL